MVLLQQLFVVAVTAASTASPQQIHIAYAGKTGTGMTISWATEGEADSSVQYGTNETSLAQTALGSSVSYIDPLYHHHTTLEGLSPSTKYFYKCGSSEGFSEIFSFMTAPGEGSAATQAPFSTSVFGDWGYGEDGHAIATRKSLEKIKSETDFVWHLGDIGYADDAFLHAKESRQGEQYEAVYNDWMNWIQNMTSTKPYMVAVGNHESECHSPKCLAEAKLKHALKNFTAYNKRWKMPYNASGSRSSMWYSYDYGLAHFVSINTETDFKGAGEEHTGDSKVIPAGGFGEDGEYLKWLEADLAKADVNRAQRPWIFAGGHRPLYTGGGGGGDALSTAFEGLFKKYKVDVYFAGHEHSYARSLPVYQKQPETSQNKEHYINPSSTTHVMVGGAGCDEMTPHADTNANCSASGQLEDCELSNSFPPVPHHVSSSETAAWNVYADAEFGTGILTVFNATTMQWRYIHSEDGQVHDEFYITKNQTR